MRSRWLAILVAATLCGGAGPRDLVREQRTVVVDGKPEVWRLVWRGTPRGACGVEDVDASLSCPCTGFAYGQAGPLALVRLRRGREVERFDLAPIFDNEMDQPMKKGEGALQRRQPRLSDMKRFVDGDPRLSSEIARRPVISLMHPADYDHDGRATEFLVQVGTLPCGKRQFAAVGVTRTAPRLHALGSAAHPEKPLVMPLHAWQALLKSPHPSPVLIWECDDHGSEVRSLLTVSADHGRIRAVDRDYGCRSQGDEGRLVKTTAW